jgi:hypothetical protein
MKLQGSEVQDHETLQSQIGKIAENRLPLSGLEIFHGRPNNKAVGHAGTNGFASISPNDTATALLG